MTDLTETPPCNIDAEVSVLGSALLSPATIPRLLKLGLTAEHFYNERHRLIWGAVVTLYDRRSSVDALTVTEHLQAKLDEAGGSDYVHGLVGQVPSLANVLDYAHIVIETAELRRRLRLASDLTSAATAHDWDRIREIEDALLTQDTRQRITYEPRELAEAGAAWLDEPDEAFPFPWPKLNLLTDGGMRRGESSVVGAHSSHGKSVVIDQILRHSAANGLKCHLYINEHTVKKRFSRMLAALTGIPHEHIRRRELGDREWKAINAALQAMHEGAGFGITEAAGWTAGELARDIRYRKPDVAAVDIFHRIATPTGKTIELDQASRVLSDATKTGLGNCHLLIAIHLNESRVSDVVRPAPTLGDIRGTGMLKNDSDFVIFVHREQDSADGRPQANGRIWFAKARDADLGGLKVRFDTKRMEFGVHPSEPDVVASQDELEKF